MAFSTKSRSSFNTRFVKSNKLGREKTAINESALGIETTSASKKFDNAALTDQLDSQMGFDRYESGPKKVGWLVNFHSTTIKSDEVIGGLAGVNFYFLDEEGGSFKATVQFDPYILLACKPGHETEVEECLRRKLDGLLKSIHRLEKENLSLANHLVGNRQNLLKIEFHNVSDLLGARKILLPFIESNKSNQEITDSYAEVSLYVKNDEPIFLDMYKLTRRSLASESFIEASAKSKDAIDYITDMFEYDVPYHVRVSIDKDIRVGKWYTVEAISGIINITEMPERIARADPVVMAYDIETTKAPLKFPDPSIDKVMMISYMIDGEGFLITNREIVSKDIDDFEYTPKPEFKGVFTVFNESTERDVLIRFFEHIREEKPTVIATFNGDFFDWPFVEARAAFHGLDMYQEIGFQKDMEEEYKSSHCAHMDCFRWVKRDSYLPQGSQGLKSVTTAKLGYNPIEIDPELMTPYAIEKPQIMAEYSVSDAVATYYLYMKYLHPFIFSLCTILPLNPDEVLRKGTGTLCEMLLMVQAYQNNIVFPHKHKEPLERFYNGHLLDAETYVGGHVESLEAGVFRSDIPCDFKIDTSAIDELLHDLDSALHFTITVEGKKDINKVTNYEEVKAGITEALLKLKDQPKRNENPSIYHVDVASMYPNIMTTNRLQPDSMITEEDCASCDFNRPGKTCDRRLPWSWRGEFLPTKRDEYLMIRRALQNEQFPGKSLNHPMRSFDDLSLTEQASMVKKRLTEYSRKVYHKIRQTEIIEREAMICQRENPFYVNTVRDFRDRRYEFKGLQKVWKKKVETIPSNDIASREEAKKMVVLYDSLQLAHKVILNSFYGYVMRKGSRWYSMEMAGVTCLTGATIIQMARSLVERIGRPLELDTDGIWCILPKTFPENFMFSLNDGKKLPISYPCVMLNHLVHAKFTNHQYQTLIDPKTMQYETKSDNSIFFEVDGPYKAMILPTSKEEDKNLKKRYAVFNEDGTLAELKGFELKRRGELRLIKAFQSQIFNVFLQGSSLTDCYDAVASVANSWLDIIESKGRTLEDEDLLDLISENRSMSKTLEEYEGQKSTSICTARRLAEFLGSQMVKDKGLACKYIISRKPLGAPVTDRAVPVAIFSAELSVQSHYLRLWQRDASLDDFDPRAIIDWGYYRERLASTIQKMITIPAALQNVKNPIPRIPHPDWLFRRVAMKNDKFKQQSMRSYLVKGKPMKDASDKANRQAGANIVSESNPLGDIEDIGRLKSTLVKRKTTAGDQENIIQVEGPILVEQSTSSLSPHDDYQAWLKVQKLKWKAQKQSRERRKHLFGESEQRNDSNLTSMIRNQTEIAYSNTWHIVQYSTSEKSGEVSAFVNINGKMQTVRIHVPRKIYVNFKDDPPMEGFISGCQVQKSGHVLPNGHQSSHLYQLTMSESTFLEEMSKPNTILKHASVEGIYESQIELKDRILLELGTRCTIDNSKPGILGKGLEKGFQLDWLQKEVDTPYLELTSFSYIFFYHMVVHDFQIFAVIPTWSTEAFMFVLRPSNGQSLPSLTKLYLEQFTSRKERIDNTNFEYQNEIKFEEFYFESSKRLYQRIGAVLSKLHSQKGTRAILCLQTQRPARLKRLIRPVNEFPILEIRQSSSVPSLGWQLSVAKKVISSYFGLSSWITHLSEMAKYSDIPICNLKCDDARYLIDIIYARKLQTAGVVLWWSRAPIPDCGGSEKDNILPMMDPLEMPVVNNADSYSKICLDLEIKNISVNTILTSSIISEAEGTDMANTMIEGIGGSIIPFVENAFSTPALKVLSGLVKDWWAQALEQNISADTMVHNFLGWVSSSNSLLYDRSLYYHVQNLSKKAFIQLIREVRRLGSQLVFANQNRLVLLTSKTILENTYAYANFLLKSIRSKPLFNYLDISIRGYWDTLVWMDEFNYGGQFCTEISSEKEQVIESQINWHLSKFLPEILQPEFEEWVLKFIIAFWKAGKARLANETSERLTQISSTALEKASSDVIENADEEDEEKKHFAHGLFRDMEKLLLKRIGILRRRYIDGISHKEVEQEFSFPILPGSHLNLTNPILELIKSLCAVFSTCKDLSLESRLLRRHLLQLVDVNEFSDEAQFQDPSWSLVVPTVLCESCGYIRDIDLCKDDNLVHEQKIANSSVFTWLCENCGKEYNRVALEELLIQQLQKTITMYQVQDLKCSKCKRVKEDNLSEHCECSGSWIETITRESIVNVFKSYKRVAEYYNYRLVEDMILSINV